jgi:peptidoglycan/xylan/chitin deacetylase (PgdA/CDA1 family)
MAHLVVLPWAGFKSAVSYTFDDSQPSQIDHYGDIAATGVRVTYYVTTANKGLADYDATWKKAALAGDEIGNHTVDHCYHDLSGCSGSGSAGSVAMEIDQCSAYITTNLGQKEVWTIAYPYGDAAYEPDAKSRFFLGRGVGGGMIAPSDGTDPFNLPVKAAAGGEGASSFSDALDAGHTQGKWLIFLFHSLLPGQNWYAGVDVGSVTQSIEHGKSLHDVWIDTVANVGAYWVGQKLVEGGAAGSSWSWKLPTHFPPSRFLRVKVDGGKLTQGGHELPWNGHGYYEVALDTGSLAWAP